MVLSKLAISYVEYESVPTPPYYGEIAKSKTTNTISLLSKWRELVVFSVKVKQLS